MTAFDACALASTWARVVLLALDSDSPFTSEVVLAVDVNPMLPLAGTPMELDVGVSPDVTEESEDEILETDRPPRGWDFLVDGHGEIIVARKKTPSSILPRCAGEDAASHPEEGALSLGPLASRRHPQDIGPKARPCCRGGDNCRRSANCAGHAGGTPALPGRRAPSRSTTY